MKKIKRNDEQSLSRTDSGFKVLDDVLTIYFLIAVAKIAIFPFFNFLGNILKRPSMRHFILVSPSSDSSKRFSLSRLR